LRYIYNTNLAPQEQICRVGSLSAQLLEADASAATLREENSALSKENQSLKEDVRAAPAMGNSLIEDLDREAVKGGSELEEFRQRSQVALAAERSRRDALAANLQVELHQQEVQLAYANEKIAGLQQELSSTQEALWKTKTAALVLRDAGKHVMNEVYSYMEVEWRSFQNEIQKEQQRTRQEKEKQTQMRAEHHKTLGGMLGRPKSPASPIHSQKKEKLLLQMHDTEYEELISAHKIELTKAHDRVKTSEEAAQMARGETQFSREVRSEEIVSLQETLKVATESFAATIRPLDEEIISLQHQLLIQEERHAEVVKQAAAECQRKIGVAESRAQVRVV